MKQLHVPPDIGPQRLDAWLGETLPNLSRARWQELIKQNHVRVDGESQKPRYILRGGETISYTIPDAEPVALTPENLDLDILFEDEHLIAINKAAGMVVHPAPGHDTGTLVHALLHHCRDLQGIHGEIRPGIVHRLDKDTSGVLVIAKSETTLLELQRQFKNREVTKQYVALAWGTPVPARGTIDVPIGRSSHHRVRMSTQTRRGRDAVTHYRVLESFAEASELQLDIETGRTHQIRVHLSHLGHPVIGDRLYGGDRKHASIHAGRQMLHARQLTLRHPASSSRQVFEAPTPADYNEIREQLAA